MTAETMKQREGWQGTVQSLANLELLWLAFAAPFLLFPSRWTAPVALLIALSWLIRRLASGRWTVYTPLNAPLALLAPLALAAYFISAAPDLSADKFWGIVLQAALFFAVVNSVTGAKRLRQVTLLALLSLCALALLSLVGADWRNVRLWELPQVYDRLPQFDLGALGLRGSILTPERTLFNPRQVGGVLGALLPFAAAIALAGKGVGLRLLAAVTLLLGGWVLLLSQALMGWFGLAVGLLLLALWRWRWLRWLTLTGAIALALASWRLFVSHPPAFWASLWSRLFDVRDIGGAGVVLRLDIWSRAVAMIREMPFTGIGLNTFPLIQSHFYTGYFIGPEPHAHNLWLQLAVDLGLPGVTLFLWLLFAFLLMSYGAYRRTGGEMARAVIVGGVASMAAYVASGTLDVVTLGAKPLLLWWLVLGLTGAAWQQAEIPRHSITVWRRAAFPASFIALLLLIWLVLPAARWRNYALLLAQPALVTARQTGTLPEGESAAALAALDRAIALDPGRAQLWGTRGSLHAWMGQPETAVVDLTQRVALDVGQPWPTYAPFLVWSAQVSGEPLPAEAVALLQVYNQWRARFPQWAENHALVAILQQTWQNNPAAARQALQQGQQAGAWPTGLLDALEDNLTPDE